MCSANISLKQCQFVSCVIYISKNLQWVKKFHVCLAQLLQTVSLCSLVFHCKDMKTNNPIIFALNSHYFNVYIVYIKCKNKRFMTNKP